MHVRRDKVDSATALCYLLARYAYPNRVTVELPMLFRRSSGHLRDIIQAVERLLLLHWEAKICSALCNTARTCSESPRTSCHTVSGSLMGQFGPHVNLRSTKLSTAHTH